MLNISEQAKLVECYGTRGNGVIVGRMEKEESDGRRGR